MVDGIEGGTRRGALSAVDTAVDDEDEVGEMCRGQTR